MNLTEKINADMKAAMKAGEKDKLAAIRAVKSALLMEATSGKGDITPEAEVALLQKLSKQRKEAAKIYVEQNREDLAEVEVFQAEVIGQYLPEMMGEDEVRAIVQKAIENSGASGPGDMGKVMGSVMGQLKGKAEGGMISSIVKEELGKLG